MANWFQCANCNATYDGDQISTGLATCAVCGFQLVVPPPGIANSQSSAERPSTEPNKQPAVSAVKQSKRKRNRASSLIVPMVIVGLIAASAFAVFRIVKFQAKRRQQAAKRQAAVDDSKSRLSPQTKLHRTNEANEAGQARQGDLPASDSTTVVGVSDISPKPPIASEQTEFHTVLAPFLQTFCVECHGANKQESALRLDDIAAQPDSRESVEVWTEMLHRLNVHEMPPKGSPQPNQKTYTKVIAFLDGTVRLAEQKLAAGEGKVVMRRLNRIEYTNTILELTGVRFDAENDFPEDEVAHGFDNIGQELVLSPSLMEKYVRAAQTITKKLVDRPHLDAFRRVMGKTDYKRGGVDDAKRVLRIFASRAFRRPVTDSKLARLMAMFNERFESGESFVESIRVPLQAVLCSPQFIYMVESPGKLDAYSVATRLSYFLWSSMPDDELLRVAHTGELLQPSSLRQQVDRMLGDPRAAAFTKNFAGQWLGLREIGIMQPDKAAFPQYSESLEESMRQETEAFFAEILQKNLSVLNFIDSDFAMLNGPLAELYRIPNVRGPRIRRVSLKPNQNRGGVLTHASILSITGDGVDSSPVMRGVWILERILGTPPSPPPPNVPDFEPDTRGTKTVREELSRHRTIESCNTCHHKIDPLGFALENYDAIGQYRERYDSRASGKNKNQSTPGIRVDASGDWPNGESFADMSEFKRSMMQRKEQFAVCLTEKLLIYACGRMMGVSDEKEIQSVVDVSGQNGYRFKDLIHQITQTDAFLSK